MAQRIAADLELQVEWVSFRWPELSGDIAIGRFDVAMSGVTWRPDRAVLGWASRAVAMGGPCLLIRRAPVRRLGVNAGGFLERWARGEFPDVELVTVAENRSLPLRLRAGDFDAIATDSFELSAFLEPGWQSRCEELIHPKVLWVGPKRAAQLGPRLDEWIAAHEPELAALRRLHFGEARLRTASDHLADLVARRLALMPLVSAWKLERGEPIQNLAAEARVLERAAANAERHGLDSGGVQRFFRAQIEAAKQVQRRTPRQQATLHLSQELRPLLLALGDRIVATLAQGGRLTPQTAAGLARWLEPAELEALLAAQPVLAGYRRAKPACPHGGGLRRRLFCATLGH